MAKRYGLIAAVALLSGALAACTSPTAPAATHTQPTHHAAPMSSAGTLIGAET